MKRSLSHCREEARTLYLTGELATNVEIAARLKVKAHTIGRWRRDDDWDGLRLKVDRRAAKMFVEKIATDRVTLNVRHYRFWELVLAKLAEDLKSKRILDPRELDRVAGILDKAQKGQRLAKGLSINGDTEETIRAQGQAEIQHLIDAFFESVKENVTDEEARDRIRRAVLEAVPDEEDEGAGEPGDALAH